MDHGKILSVSLLPFERPSTVYPEHFVSLLRIKASDVHG
jgi:hypothetical protein